MCYLVLFSHINLVFTYSFQVNGGIENTLEKEVVKYDFYSSYFDIFVSIFCFIFQFSYNETLTKRPISSQQTSNSVQCYWFPPLNTVTPFSFSFISLIFLFMRNYLVISMKKKKRLLRDKGGQQKMPFSFSWSRMAEIEAIDINY